MKKSEQLRIDAQSAESDQACLGLHTKALREEREERFVEKYLPLLKEKIGNQVSVDPINRVYLFDTEKFGRILFYPKANKLFLKKQNKWIKPGLQWLIKNFELK
jgi:hypothetical protein